MANKNEEMLKVEQTENIFQGYQYEQEENENSYLKKMNSQFQSNLKIQESRDHRLGMNFKDSDSMTQLKQAHNALLQYYFTTSIESNATKFTEQKNQIKLLYNNVIESCNNYITLHRNPWSKSGKARKNMARSILEMCLADMAAFDEVASYVHKNMNTVPVSWANVIALLRPINLDEQDYEVSFTGGQINQVKILKNENETIFFKKKEKNIPVSEEIEQKYLTDKKYEHLHSVMRKFMQIADADMNSVFYTCLNGITKNDSKTFVASIKNMYSATQEEWPYEEKEESLLLEAVDLMKQDIARWFIRLNASRECKIEIGSSLDNRNIATCRIADLLGISDLVCGAENVCLTTKDKKRELGIGMEKVKGKTIGEITKETGRQEYQYSKEVIMKLAKLMIFDALCGQLDRNTTNLFFEYDERVDQDGNKVTVLKNVVGIDNDMSFGKLTFEDITKYKDGNMKLPNILSKENGLLIDFLDADFYDAILELSPEISKMTLNGLLPNVEIEAFNQRLNALQSKFKEHPEIRTEAKDYSDEKAHQNMEKASQNPNSYIVHTKV